MSVRVRRLALHATSIIAVGTGYCRMLQRHRRARGDLRVFILEYHGISPQRQAKEGEVSRPRFLEHLRYLNRHFRICTLSEASERLSQAQTLTQDLLVLTFDDGYENNFTEAWPVLQNAGVSATVFLTTGFLDGKELWFDLARRTLRAAAEAGEALDDSDRNYLRSLFKSWPVPGGVEQAVNYLKYLGPKERSEALGYLSRFDLPMSEASRPLTWEQVRKMAASGVEIGCHTISHPILSLLDDKQQENEILGGQKRITEETGVRPTLFAYPNGSTRDYNSATLGILKMAGFQAACTTSTGSNRPGCDPLLLRRIGVGSDPPWVLQARLAGLFNQELRQFVPIPRR